MPENAMNGNDGSFLSLTRMRQNPWILATILLAVIFVVYFFTKGSLTGNVLTGNVASESDVIGNLVSFASAQGIVLENVTTEDMGSFYAVKFLINGNQSGAYITKDGGYLIQPIAALTVAEETQTKTSASTEVQKSDKPTAELYVFSYCPAGTAALDSFAKVGKVLNTFADIKVKFFSNMHGDHEKQQNMIQECIQKVAKDKYWDYASQYVSKVYNVCGSTRSVDCDKTEAIKLMKLVGINSDAVMTCVNNQGDELYAQDQADAIELSLQYSPSVVVNGVYLENADRTPEGLKTLVCGAFNSAPSVCSQALSTTSTASSGSCS